MQCKERASEEKAQTQEEVVLIQEPRHRIKDQDQELGLEPTNDQIIELNRDLKAEEGAIEVEKWMITR
jgi:hypothetical protein